MPRFKVTVTEVREIDVEYEIEADTLEQAQEKAENGQTDKETPNALSMTVTDRQVGNDWKKKVGKDWKETG